MSRYYTSVLWTLNLKEYLLEDLKRKEKLVIIPTNFEEIERIERYEATLENYLLELGIKMDETIILNKRMSKEEMQEQILAADMIFLMGGNPNDQLEIINGNSLGETLKNTSAVLIGMSAGAMCMSKFSWMLPVNEKYPTIDIRPALNLSGISIYPHYNTDGEIPEEYTNDDETTCKKDILKVAAEYGDCYYLNDNSCIIERDGELIFVGNNIIRIDKNKIEVINHPDKTEKMSI